MVKYSPPQPYFQEQDDLLFALKPAKLMTHQSTAALIGFKEYLEFQLKIPLWVTHRLDLGTSGVMVFAKSKAAAQKMALLFKENKVTKKDYFVFRGPRPPWTLKKEKTRVETEAAQTDIFYINSLSDQDHLFCAVPFTDKNHQIQKHAAEINISILGDKTYGKQRFSRLMLFAQEIEFEWNQKSVQFQNPFLHFASANQFRKLMNPFFLSYLDRKYLFHSSNPDLCYRLTHESNFPIKIDRFGKKMALYNYENPLQEKTNQDLKEFEKWMMELEQTNFLPLQSMENRGAIPKNDKTQLSSHENWVVQENGMSFSLRRDRGLSCGLFLDQRENRKFVFENSKDKNVLNLFAYTSGFSLAAALGGAKSVCTVDVSPTFIQWSKENFELNHLELNKYEFWVQESMLFMKACKKRNRRFDLIICDPPSLGRNKDQVFRIDKDWETLISLCESVLAKNGMILFSNNYEKWSYKTWYQKLRAWNKFGFEINLGLRSPDYEAFHSNPIMKSFFMTRGNQSVDIPPHCKITSDSDLMGI